MVRHGGMAAIEHYTWSGWYLVAVPGVLITDGIGVYDVDGASRLSTHPAAASAGSRQSSVELTQ